MPQKSERRQFLLTTFLIFLSMILAPSGAKYCEKGWGRFKKGGEPFWNFLGFLDFREISSRDQVWTTASAGGLRPRGTPLELPSLDLGFLEAALAADLITA